MYSRVPARPVIVLENHYEDWPGIDGQRWNASLVRNGAWHAVFAGGSGTCVSDSINSAFF